MNSQNGCPSSSTISNFGGDLMTAKSSQRPACQRAEHNPSDIGPEAFGSPAPRNSLPLSHIPQQPALPRTAAALMSLYVFTKLPNVSTMNAMIATQNAYWVTSPQFTTLGARNRYPWFGRRDACMLPNSDRSWPSCPPRLRNSSIVGVSPFTFF